ncbi:hypothetical protein [Endozoicomonas atrinae]|uniref:hypothetical protein n=1 Tax=Endozoicomonas atrinae TaxID=1333660 RepID=UPI003AFFE18C
MQQTSSVNLTSDSPSPYSQTEIQTRKSTDASVNNTPKVSVIQSSHPAVRSVKHQEDAHDSPGNMRESFDFLISDREAREVSHPNEIIQNQKEEIMRLRARLFSKEEQIKIEQRKTELLKIELEAKIKLLQEQTPYLIQRYLSNKYKINSFQKNSKKRFINFKQKSIDFK